ncbi:MAG: hypothetical protein JKX88_00210 [Marinicaulis sp.]|nr:hypothetical protein [Marinicaulis sp.]
MAEDEPVELYAHDAVERAPLRRIRRFSRPFEIGFLVLAVAASAFWLLIVILAFAPGGPFIFLSPNGAWLTLNPARLPEDAVAFRDLPMIAKLAGLLTAALIYGAQIIGLIFLSKLFGFYRRGVVFNAAPIKMMRRAGAALMVGAIAPGLMQPLIRATGALDKNWFHMESVAFLLVGAALFLFAHIMALGVEIERENKGFV